MRNRTSTTVGAALVLALMVFAAANTGADSRSKRKDTDFYGQPFNTSGTFSGALGGSIVVGGVLYQLSPDVQLYEIGRGLVPVGEAYNGRFVFLSGARSGGSELIYSVIIRPASDGTESNLRPTLVDDSTPQ